ncbi:MAG TPA: PKD domain-containing protein, partial [Bacteroidetes bacterium]|nr:PKD domain-containing protein [Bacteroidota bacterium]
MNFHLFKSLTLLFIISAFSLKGQQFSIDTPFINLASTGCSGTLYDSGGPNNDYSINENHVCTIQSGLSNQCVQLNFIYSIIKMNNYGDSLIIYDGAGISSDTLIVLTGNAGGVQTGTINSQGFMTLEFKSDSFICAAGFEIQLSCAPCGFEPAPTEQDCLGAIPVCQSTYNQTMSYSGTGNYANEINYQTSCLGEGEKNNSWYIFNIQQSGDLCFSITPNSTDDYDWALYDLTNSSCKDIFTDSTLEVRCNYDVWPGITGANGLGGSPNEPCVPVNKGETYVLNVSNYQSTQNGYLLDFSASTAAIYDNYDPYIDSVKYCGGDTIWVFFSEKISCASLDSSDFKFVGQNGIIPHSVVGGLNCENGALYDNPVIVVLDSSYGLGEYDLFLIDSVLDQCNNPAIYDSFNLDNFISIGHDFYPLCSQKDVMFKDTSIGKVAKWVWETGDGATYEGATVYHVYANSGDYNVTVTLTDSNGCELDSNFTIKILSGPLADFSFNPSTEIDKGALVSFTDMSSYSYSWQWSFSDGGSSNEQNPKYAFNSSGN